MQQLAENDDPTRAPEYTPNIHSIFNRSTPENSAICCTTSTICATTSTNSTTTSTMQNMRPMDQGQRQSSYPGSYPNSDHFCYASTMQSQVAHSNVQMPTRQQPVQAPLVRSSEATIHQPPRPSLVIQQQQQQQQYQQYQIQLYQQEQAQRLHQLQQQQQQHAFQQQQQTFQQQQPHQQQHHQQQQVQTQMLQQALQQQPHQQQHHQQPQVQTQLQQQLLLPQQPHQQVLPPLYPTSNPGFQQNYSPACNPNTLVNHQVMYNSTPNHDPSNHVTQQYPNSRPALIARMQANVRPTTNPAPRMSISQRAMRPVRPMRPAIIRPPLSSIAVQTSQAQTQSFVNFCQAALGPQTTNQTNSSIPILATNHAPAPVTQITALPTPLLRTEVNLSNTTATTTAPINTTTTITAAQTTGPVQSVPSVSSITSVSVSSTTRPPSATSVQSVDGPQVNKVEKANKACQVKVNEVVMVNRCMNTSALAMENKESQTDFVEKEKEKKTYIDRACSPIPSNALVRFKITPKRRKIAQPEETDSKSDEEVINVIE